MQSRCINSNKIHVEFHYVTVYVYINLCAECVSGPDKQLLVDKQFLTLLAVALCWLSMHVSLLHIVRTSVCVSTVGLSVNELLGNSCWTVWERTPQTVKFML